jgi:hypothetical protein
MDAEKIIKICIIFLIGFLSANLVSFYVVYGLESPFSFNNFSFNDNNSAPFDFVEENQIKIYNDKIVIDIKDASLSRYAPTGSMKPVLDQGSNGIRIVPKSKDEIHVGDIITFKQDNYLIVHRVIEIGSDVDGLYFITKGDNNSISDGKVRFEDIKYITIGVIW